MSEYLNDSGVVRNEEEREKHKETVQQLFHEKRYKDVCDFVDSLFGWNPGEIERSYTKEEAIRVMKFVVS